MNKTVFALLMAGTLMVPHISPALGNDSLLRKAEWKTIEAYLPPPSAGVPWLQLDPRTKLPKGDFPIGREVDAFGMLALRAAELPGRLSWNEVPGASWKM